MANYYAGRGSFRQNTVPEDTDPMSSLANLADVMLVFACGLMVSLIIAWNVDVTQFQQIDVGEEQAIDEPDAIDELNQGGGTNYIERGTVYMDAETGQYYLVEPTGDGADNTGGAAGSSDAQANPAGTAGAEETPAAEDATAGANQEPANE